MASLSDDLDDFVDTYLSEDPVLNSNLEEEEASQRENAKVNSEGRRVRGKDLVWKDFEDFETADEFKASDLKKKLDEEFTLRRSNSWDYADVEIYTCKYSRRAAYLPCPLIFKVNFLSNSEGVVVQTTEDSSEHLHELDPEFSPDGTNMFRWPSAATVIITNCVKNDVRPKVIMRNLREANIFDGRPEPSMIQLYNKIANVKRVVYKTRDILTTHDLRQKIDQQLDVPGLEHEAFIPFSEVLDDEEEDPRFTVIKQIILFQVGYCNRSMSFGH